MTVDINTITRVRVRDPRMLTETDCVNLPRSIVTDHLDLGLNIQLVLCCVLIDSGQSLQGIILEPLICERKLTSWDGGRVGP